MVGTEFKLGESDFFYSDKSPFEPAGLASTSQKEPSSYFPTLAC